METFIQACIDGDEASVKQYLATSSALANARGKVHPDHREFMRGQDSEDGWTALHLAAHYSRPDIVRLLIDAGANVNALAMSLAQGEGRAALAAVIKEAIARVR